MRIVMPAAIAALLIAATVVGAHMNLGGGPDREVRQRSFWTCFSVSDRGEEALHRCKSRAGY